MEKSILPLMERKTLDTDQKALEINLNEAIYGTFAEIGAGQEVARYFFKVGGAAGTIAKTMSAYDKIYSDEIYGVEPQGRYVCESRLYKMLNHEYSLMEQRLETYRAGRNFFVFADTVATINYSRTIKGDGWLGLRFQLHPDAPPNDLVLHVKMLDNDQQTQQSAIGIVGVNMIHAAFYYHQDAERMICSLMDGLAGRVYIDMIRLTGPDFQHLDNRLLSYLLVRHGLTRVAMFGSDKQSMHASELVYKKAVMVVRGHFKPPTLVTLDVFTSGFRQFLNVEQLADDEQAVLLPELTMENLQAFDTDAQRDFLDRAETLNALGYPVIISNYQNHQDLINYLADYKISKLGLVIGVKELLEIIERKYIQIQDGRLLVAFGELFTRNIRIYAYPALDRLTGEVVTGKNLLVPEGIKFLYQYLLESRHIVEIGGYRQDLLFIQPQDVLTKMLQDDPTWETMVPPLVREAIVNQHLFNQLVQA